MDDATSIASRSQAHPGTQGTAAERVEKAYASIATYEHHFNNMETEVRKFASAWLLAALAAIAYVVRQEIPKALLDAMLLIVIVCLIANIGLLILWILDQLVYHRLLKAVFLLGLRMEFKYSELPPIRTLMMLFSKRRGMSRFLRLFYLVPMTIFGAVAAVAAVWRLVGTGSTPLSFVGIVSLLAGTIAIPLWAYNSGKNEESYSDIGSGFGDPTFVQYIKDAKFESVLAKH